MDCYYQSIFFMNMRRYIVAWIPVTKHSLDFIDHPLKKKVEENISDDPDNDLILRLILSSNKNIKIYLNPNSQSQEYTYFLTLQYLRASNNGLICYEFDDTILTISDFEIRLDDFIHDLHNLILSLYHKHEFHKELLNDSIKKADEPLLTLFITDDFINIQTDNNPALIHYLKEFERVVNTQTQDARSLLHDLSNSKRKRKKEKFYQAFPTLYVRTIGYKSYLNSLYKSKYNRSCVLESEDNELRRIALNIECGIEYLEALNILFKNKIENHHHNLSMSLSYLGAIISLIAMGISIWQSCDASIELRNSTEELKSTINELKQQNKPASPILKPITFPIKKSNHLDTTFEGFLLPTISSKSNINFSMNDTIDIMEDKESQLLVN